MQAKLNPALRGFWRTRADVKILKGGRASGKSWDAAGININLGARYKLKTLCLRQFQNRIEDSVYALLVHMIERFGLADEFVVQNNKIIHRETESSWHFYGFNRHINEIKSFEGADICWIEEGQGLTKNQWQIIEPTIRKQGSQCWIIYNPNLVTDFVETFKHDPDNGVIVRHINYDENHFLSDTMLRKIQKAKEADYDDFEHVYLGVPKTDDDKVIIKLSWINAAIDAHLKLGIEESGTVRLGFDIADSGADKNALVGMRGIVAFHAEEWKGGEDKLLDSSKRAYNKALEFGATIDYDSIGVGANAGPKFKEINEERERTRQIGRVSYSKFVAGAGVVDPDGFYVDTLDARIKNKDFFSNLKSQAWWYVADRFRNTYNAVVNGHQFEEHELISISSDIPHLEKLKRELSTPRRDFEGASNKVKVESKKDLDKRDVASPNLADAFIMANAPQQPNHMENLLTMAMKR